MVEHFKEFGTGLMNGADYSAAALRQRLQYGDALKARRAVETAAIKREENIVNLLFARKTHAG